MEAKRYWIYKNLAEWRDLGLATYGTLLVWGVALVGLWRAKSVVTPVAVALPRAQAA